MEMGKKPAKRLLPRIGDRNPTRLVSLSLSFSPRSDDVWSIVSIALKPLIIPARIIVAALKYYTCSTTPNIQSIIVLLLME